MIRLLKIEWMKVKNYRTFWVLLLITIVSIPAFNYTVYDLMDNSFPKIRGKNILGSPFAFPEVWQTIAWNSALLLLIPAVLVITLTTNEFTYRTHRQNVIDGWSRNQFINVKLLEVFLLSALTTLVVFLTTFIFGYFTNAVPADVSILHQSRFIWFYFVQMISYSLIAFLIGMFVKRAGLAMGVFFIYMIGEQFVVAILRNKYKMDWVNFLPEEVTDMLIPQPYTQKLMGGDKINTWETHIPVYLVVSGIYLVFYMAVTNWRFRKSDL
jgi:ABC-type transport system involved in multi-copper enzyme maturation permease subunit